MKLIDWPAGADLPAIEGAKVILHALREGKPPVLEVKPFRLRPARYRVCGRVGSVEDLETGEIILFNGPCFKAMKGKFEGYLQRDLFGLHAFVKAGRVDDLSDIPF